MGQSSWMTSEQFSSVSDAERCSKICQWSFAVMNSEFLLQLQRICYERNWAMAAICQFLMMSWRLTLLWGAYSRPLHGYLSLGSDQGVFFHGLLWVFGLVLNCSGYSESIVKQACHSVIDGFPVCVVHPMYSAISDNLHDRSGSVSMEP